MCVGRNSKIIPSGGKRQVQPLISDVAKKMRMSSNLAKRKREEEEPAHLEDDWEGELHSNSSTFVCFDKYGHGEVATFCKLPVSPVNHGKNTVSKTSNILSIVDESCFNDISETAKIIQAEEELDVLTNMVEYSAPQKLLAKI